MQPELRLEHETSAIGHEKFCPALEVLREGGFPRDEHPPPASVIELKARERLSYTYPAGRLERQSAYPAHLVHAVHPSRLVVHERVRQVDVYPALEPYGRGFEEYLAVAEVGRALSLRELEDVPVPVHSKF